MRPVYTTGTRSPSRPRGKWHLLIAPTLMTTICNQKARGWDIASRSDLDPRDICTNCLRDTP